MKIGIDISQIVYGTGVSTYTENLVSSLLKLDNKNEYVLFGGSLRRLDELRTFLDTLQDNVQGKIFPVPPSLANIIWNSLHILPIEKLVGKLDVFHSSDWTQPPSKAFKVTTIHELWPVLFPKLTDKKIVDVHRQRLHWVKKEVDRIIAVSSATKNDLVKLGFDEEKIKVIYEAVDPVFRRVSEESFDKVKAKYKIQGKYLLGIGISERKNTRRIIEAYRKARFNSLSLVLVGNPQIKLENLDGVVLLGHVEDEYLPALYSGAEALVYPSLYEGFGLPILEAFACECPVVTSNTSSLSEVAGGAAILVDPLDTKSIVEGFKKVLESKAELIKKGKKRVKMFSWEKTARETLKVYDKASSI